MAVIPAASGRAQTPLTLSDAMRRARTVAPAARALAAADREAGERVRQARAGYFPRVDVSESVQRGNHPVFVFGSLLSQQRFGAADFALDALNRPSPVTSVRTAVALDQPVFDAGLTRLKVEGAAIGRDITAARRMGAEQDLALGAARAFVDVLRLESASRASEAGAAAAESDLERAGARRDSGLATDADVLEAEVHVADLRERVVTTLADLAVARIQLNEVIGAALEEGQTLVAPDVPPAPPAADTLVREALSARSERRAAELGAALAANARRTAQAAFLPRVGVQGGWEFNGQRLTDQRASWIVGAQVQMRFHAFGDLARVAEARHSEIRVRAERDGVDRAIAVEVRSALARLNAARDRERVGQMALRQARESQRIVRDRYDGGLATIGDVLRATETVLDAESRATSARMDVVIRSVELDRAVGRL
jgi:outer membrane protein TolC